MSLQPQALNLEFKDVAPAFPTSLKQLERWIVRTDDKKPFSAYEEDDNRGPIDPHDPQFQADYDTALGALEETTRYSGLGFVFNYRDRLTGLDFDDCVTDRQIRPDIRAILAKIDSYAEFSPSGTGIHVFVTGWQFPIGSEGQQGANIGKAEIYSGKRYFTVTGDHVPETPTTVNDCDLDWLYERIVKNREFATSSDLQPLSVPDRQATSSVPVVSTTLFATNKLELLMTGSVKSDSPFLVDDGVGNSVTYPSHSEADLALCNLLALKHEDNPDLIDEEFRKSPLYRQKWERDDYRQSTISKAIASAKTAIRSEGDGTSGIERTLTGQEYESELDKDFPVIPLAEQAGPSWSEDILYGPSGALIKKASEYNEAHPAGMLLNFLIAFGNMIGRGPYFNINSTRHYTNEFLARVGDSSYSRKGGGRDAIDEPLKIIDSNWFRDRVLSGFGSSEAIISNLRDGSTQQKLNKKTNTFIEIPVPGITDKRLCIRESELASVFVLASKAESRADIVLREGWDSKPLRNVVKGKTDGISNSAVCMEPHLSISGDTTRHELVSKMPDGADENGFGNRFLYCYVYRVKLCPHGGPEINWSNEIAYFHEALQFAKTQKYIPLSASAKKAWTRMYAQMEEDRLPGMAGKMTSRGPAHIRRLALIYALIDKSGAVESRHLQAARRLWEYCLESARYIFNKCTKEQLQILRFVEQKETVSLTEIREELFRRNKLAGWIRAQVSDLARSGYLSQAGEQVKYIKK